jgi:Family of unknown function (DUF6161)/MIR domain
MLTFYSAICLRHVATNRYLSSRAKRYRPPPHGSGQQMVFATAQPSDESRWIVKPANGANEADITRSTVANGATIRLEHKPTKKNLHSHGQFKSPLTGQQETTAYGSFGVGNHDDDWVIELIECTELQVGARLVLRHVSTGNVLHSHPNHASQELTDGEQEVTCLPRGDDNDLWDLADINASLERAPNPLVSATAEGRFGTLNFYSIDEFAAWFSSEKRFWSWIQSTPGISALNQAFRDVLSSIEAALTEAINRRDGDDAPRRVADLARVVNAVYPSGKWLASIEPKARFLEEVRVRKGNLIAANALAFFLSQAGSQGQSRETFEGAFIAFAYEAGLAGIAASEMASFSDARRTVEVEAELLRKGRQDLFAQDTEVLKGFADRSEKQIAEWESKRKDADERLKVLEAVFHNKIGVESSVGYWKRKGWFNFALACVFALGGMGAGIFFYFGLTRMAGELLGMEKIGVHDYWRFAVIVFSLTFAIWICRLLVRLVFSNLHQWTDARERQTMIQTYLALRKEGYLPENKELSLVLGVLFRPGDSGLLREEKGPATPAELMVKIVDRGDDKKG